MVTGTLPRCHFCGETATFQDCCEDCYAEHVELQIEPEELWIEFPVELSYQDMRRAMSFQPKAKDCDFMFLFKPFTLENLIVFRSFLLQKHCHAIIHHPRQVKGSRGGAAKEWKMLVEETVTFSSVVGEAFLPNSATNFGSGRRFSPDAMTMWVPPLEFTLTATDVDGRCNSKCTIRARGLRVTEHGFSMTRRKMKPAILTTAQRYASIGTFRYQQWIQQQCSMLNVQMEMFPHALLQMVLPHAAAGPAAPAALG